MDSFLKIYVVGWLVNSRCPEPKPGHESLTYYTVSFLGGSLEFSIPGGDSSVDALVNSGRRVQVLIPGVARASARVFNGQAFVSTQIVCAPGAVEVKAID